jgi:hypothetical protein
MMLEVYFPVERRHFRFNTAEESAALVMVGLISGSVFGHDSFYGTSQQNISDRPAGCPCGSDIAERYRKRAARIPGRRSS